MIKKIHHIGIVVDDFNKSKQMYGKLLGLKYLKDEELPDHGCKIAFFDCGETMIELIYPTGPGKSQDFIEKHGPGIHHICYEVEDIEQAFKMAKTHFKTEQNKTGQGGDGCKIFFLDAASIGNVETEFTSG